MNHPKSGNQQARISNGYCCMTNPVRKSCTSLWLSGMFTHLLSQVFFGQCNHLWICTKGTNYFDGLLTFIYKSDLYLKSALKSFGNQPGLGRKPASNSRSKAVANAADENKINKIFEAFVFSQGAKYYFVLSLKKCYITAPCPSFHSVYFCSVQAARISETNQLHIQLQPKYLADMATTISDMGCWCFACVKLQGGEGK